MVIGAVGRDAVRLAVHTTLAVGETALAVALVVALVVGVVVAVVAARVLSVTLRLRSLRRSLLGLLLSLRGGVRSRMATVLAIGGSAEASLRVHVAALGVLAEVISLRSVVAAKRSLRCSCILLAVLGVLAVVLAVVAVVGVSVGLVSGVVVRVVAGSGAVGSLGRLRRGGRGERVLRSRRSLLSEGIHGFLSSSVLGAEAAVLLLVLGGGLGGYLAVSIFACVGLNYKLTLTSRSHTGRRSGGVGLLGKGIRDSDGLGDGRKRSTRVRDRGVVGRLSTRLSILTITVNIIITVVQVEGAELNSSAINLAVTRHANSLLLVQDTALVAGHASSVALGSLDGGGSVAADRSTALVLLLGGRQWGGVGTKRALSRIPGVSGGACSGTCGRWLGVINNLF